MLDFTNIWLVRRRGLYITSRKKIAESLYLKNLHVSLVFNGDVFIGAD